MIGFVIWIWIFSTFLETVAIANQEAKRATAFIILASLSKTLLMGGAVLIFATVESFIYAALIQGIFRWYIFATCGPLSDSGTARSSFFANRWSRYRLASPYSVDGTMTSNYFYLSISSPICYLRIRFFELPR